MTNPHQNTPEFSPPSQETLAEIDQLKEQQAVVRQTKVENIAVNILQQKQLPQMEWENKLPKSFDWISQLKDRTVLSAPVNPAVVPDTASKETLMQSIWSGMNLDQRKDLVMEIIHEIYSNGSADLVGTITFLESLEPQDMFINEQAVLVGLLETSGAYFGLKQLDQVATDDSILNSLHEKYTVMYGGYPHPSQQLIVELNEHFKTLQLKGTDVDTIEYEDFFDSLDSSPLKGCFKHNVANVQLHFEHYRNLFHKNELQHQRLTDESEREREDLRQKIELAKPSLTQEMLNNFHNQSPGRKLLIAGIGIAALYMVFKGLKSKNKGAKVLAWGVALAGSAVILKPLLNGTKAGELIDTGVDWTGEAIDGWGKQMTGHEEPREPVVPSDLLRYREVSGESVALDQLMGSSALTQVPLRHIVDNYELHNGARSGELKVQGELAETIKDIGGTEPENYILLGAVQKEAKCWGIGLAHMFYLLGVLQNKRNRDVHVNTISREAAKYNGNFDQIPNGPDRVQYERIAREGIDFARGSNMTITDLVEIILSDDIHMCAKVAMADPTMPQSGTPDAPVSGEPPSPISGEPNTAISGEPSGPTSGEPSSSNSGQPQSPQSGEPEGEIFEAPRDEEAERNEDVERGNNDQPILNRPIRPGDREDPVERADEDDDELGTNNPPPPVTPR